MKKLFLSAAAFIFSLAAYAQLGDSCSVAVPVVANNVCVPGAFATQRNHMWFKFLATSKRMQIIVTTPEYGVAINGVSGPHIHSLSLLEGTCPSPTVKETEYLALVYGSKEIVLDAEGLSIGNSYYILLSRSAAGMLCSPTILDPIIGNLCVPNNTVAFTLCVRSINMLEVTIPVDLSAEPPSPAHTYYQNKGQVANTSGTPVFNLSAYTNHVSPAVYLSDTAVSFVYAQEDTVASTQDTLHRVDMTLVGMAPGIRPFKMEKTDDYLNYFLGHCPEGVTNVKGYSRVVYKDVYPFINLQCYSGSMGTKFYFTVRPGGNPNAIVLNFKGASSVKVTPAGKLQVITVLDTLLLEAHAFQPDSAGTGHQPPWQTSEFVLLPSIPPTKPTLVMFNLQNDTFYMNRDLIIQVDRGHTAPTIAASDWSTYDGGNDYDEGTGVITDGSGNAYFCGVTGSSNFPNIVGGIFTSNPLGDRAAYINKYDPIGVPVWGTYYGGAGIDKAYDIDFNSLGDFYIVGYTTSSNLPQAANSIKGAEDGFIARFNSTATAILFAKYFGGTGGDETRGVAIDALNNVYIVGETTSGTGSNFPFVPKTGAYNQSSTTATSGYPDAFIAEFDVSNTQIWGSYFGGDDFDNFTSIAIGANNSVLCAGSTLSATAATTNALNTPCGVPNSPSYFPDCDPGGNAYHRIWLTTALTGNHDAIIAEFNQNGALNWSTYFGGDGSETANSGFLGYGFVKNAIALNPNNNNILYLAGRTQKFSNFPTQFTSGEYGQAQSFTGSSTRAFIAKFDTRVLEWATLYGAGPQTLGFDLTVDNDDNVYLTGMTQCTTYASVSCTTATNPNTEFPVCDVPGAFFQPTYGGGGGAWLDVFISAFNANNALIWSTLYGGNSGDEQRACTYDPIFSRLYLSGRTTSTSNFPLRDPQTGNYQQNNSGGGPNSMDAFIARFDVTPIIALSTENLSEGLTDLNIFPNPTRDNININIASKSAGDMTLNIYNTLGEQVFVRNDKIIPSDNYYSINVSSFSNGIYFIRVGFGKNFYCAKFIIQ